MSPSTPAPCSHERRPGTTVCLRCRHEARIAGRKRAFTVALRVCAVLLAVATLGAVGSTAVRALRAREATATHAMLPSATAAGELSDSAGPRPTTTTSDAGEDSTAAIAAPLAAAASPNEPIVSAPIVDEGRTDLGDGLFAVRDGEMVTVHFDVPQARTRRRDKFDRIVRATLPRIYGPVAQATLDRIPQGDIVAAGTLPTELQDSGLRIPLTDSSTLSLWPEIRDAQGGPLVVGYRTEVAR